MQAALFSFVPPEVAWRWMFAAGALPALLVFFLRRYVAEPEVAAEARAHLATKGDRPGLWEIFAPGIRRTTLLAALLGTGAQGGYYAISTWVPTFLRGERGLTVIGSSGYLAVLISGSFVGYLLGAWLADRIGRRPLFILSAITAIVLVVVYTTLPFSNTVMLWLGFPLVSRHQPISPGWALSSPNSSRRGSGAPARALPTILARHRGAVPNPGRLPFRHRCAVHRHRVLRGDRLRATAGGCVAFTRNARQGAAGWWLNGAA